MNNEFSNNFDLYLWLSDDESFKKEVEKMLPSYIPKDFYYAVSKCLSISEENLTRYPKDKESSFLVKCLQNLISKNSALEDFYKKTSQNINFLAEIFDNFLKIADFAGDPHKTTQGEDYQVVERLEIFFKNLQAKLRESFYVREEVLNKYFAKILQDYFRKNLSRQLEVELEHLPEDAPDEKDRKIQEYKALCSQLGLNEAFPHPAFLNISFFVVIEEFLKILPQASKLKHAKYPIRKISPEESALKHYAIQIFKKTMKKHSMPPRAHVRYIKILLLEVMEVKVSDENDIEADIRKALAPRRRQTSPK